MAQNGGKTGSKFLKNGEKRWKVTIVSEKWSGILLIFPWYLMKRYRLFESIIGKMDQNRRSTYLDLLTWAHQENWKKRPGFSCRFPRWWINQWEIEIEMCVTVWWSESPKRWVCLHIYLQCVCVYIYIYTYHDMIHTYHYIHMYTYRGIYITWYVYIIIYVILSCIRWWSKHQFCGEHPNIRALGRSSQQLLPWISWPLKSEKSMEHHLYRSNKIH